MNDKVGKAETRPGDNPEDEQTGCTTRVVWREVAWACLWLHCCVTCSKQLQFSESPFPPLQPEGGVNGSYDPSCFYNSVHWGSGQLHCRSRVNLRGRTVEDTLEFKIPLSLSCTNEDYPSVLFKADLFPLDGRA